MIFPRREAEAYSVPTSKDWTVYTLADILSPSFLFGYVTILAETGDIIKSKFGHIRHSECEVGHTVLLLYLIV
jgi:hypothetical protein